MRSNAKGSLPLYMIAAIAAFAACAVLFVLLRLPESVIDGVVSILSLAQTWKSEQYGPAGLVVTTSYNPSAIIFVTAVAIVTLMALAMGGLWLWDVSRRLSWSLAHMHPAHKVDVATKQLDGELAKIVALIRVHLESSETYSASLAQAHKSLLTRAEPKQIQTVIELLISEHKKMQRETADLRTRLQQSQKQIETLRASLSNAEEMGLRDSLTSVGNRRCFDETLAKEIAEARQTKTDLSLIMCDIDHFKRLNDTFGHVIGDEVLKLFARLLCENVKGRDTVTRYGGEEFAVILPSTSLSSAVKLAERIRQQFESKDLTINKSGKRIGKLTASFGVASLSDADTAESLVQHADFKLYDAKRAGRNCIGVYGRA